MRAGGGIGGSLRVRGVHSHPTEHETLLPHPPFLSRRDRRALSLELPEPLQRPPPLRKKSVSAEHHDCNGKGPGPQGPLLAEIYPQLNVRKDKIDLDEDTEYVSDTDQELLCLKRKPAGDFTYYLNELESLFLCTCSVIFVLF